MKKRTYRIALLVLLAVMKDAIMRGDWIVDGRCDPSSAVDFAARVLRKTNKRERKLTS